jgi:hypothetical protein
VLPDYWIAIGYVQDDRVFISRGEPVRKRLVVSPALYTDADRTETGADPDADWLIDFERAVQVGR